MTELIDLSSLVDEVLRLMRTVVPRHVIVETDLGRGLPAIEADAGQLRLVVVTIVTNAIEAIGEGQGAVAVRTRAGRFTREAFGDAIGAHTLPRVSTSVWRSRTRAVACATRRGDE